MFYLYNILSIEVFYLVDGGEENSFYLWSLNYLNEMDNRFGDCAYDNKQKLYLEQFENVIKNFFLKSGHSLLSV